MRDVRTALDDLREVDAVYRQAIELTVPHWNGQPDHPRYVSKRVAIRLLECAIERRDVLVGVVLLRAHHKSIAEHSVKCAALMAALVEHLGLPRRAQLDAVNAALLHHLGQDTHGIYAADRDALAQRSLLSLLLAPSADLSHYRQLLAAFQHGLGHDGSGAPRLDFPVLQHPLSQLLTVVNDFVEHASAGTAVTRTGRRGSKDTGRPLTAGAALKKMLAGSGTRYHPALLTAFAQVIGPVQVGALVRLVDGRTCVVVGYASTLEAWQAHVVDIEDPSLAIELGAEHGAPIDAQIDGVFDTVAGLSTLSTRTGRTVAPGY